jgi:hypothetical protein
MTSLTQSEKESLKRALQEVEEGKTQPIKELVKELNLKKDVHC